MKCFNLSWKDLRNTSVGTWIIIVASIIMVFSYGLTDPQASLLRDQWKVINNNNSLLKILILLSRHPCIHHKIIGEYKQKKNPEKHRELLCHSRMILACQIMIQSKILLKYPKIIRVSVDTSRDNSYLIPLPPGSSIFHVTVFSQDTLKLHFS